MQDLKGFSVPKGFRGGNGIKVQLWCLFIAPVWRKNRKKRSHPTFCKNYLSVEINAGRLRMGWG